MRRVTLREILAGMSSDAQVDYAMESYNPDGGPTYNAIQVPNLTLMVQHAMRYRLSCSTPSTPSVTT